jgi:hypothetical protein
MLARDLDRDQDVARLGLVPGPAGHLDDVIAELGEHRLRQLVQVDREGYGVELGSEGAPGPFPEVTALVARDSVRRFALGDLGKGGSACQLLADGLGAGLGRGRVGRVRDA